MAVGILAHEKLWRNPRLTAMIGKAMPMAKRVAQFYVVPEGHESVTCDANCFPETDQDGTLVWVKVKQATARFTYTDPAYPGSLYRVEWISGMGWIDHGSEI